MSDERVNCPGATGVAVSSTRKNPLPFELMENPVIKPSSLNPNKHLKEQLRSSHLFLIIIFLYMYVYIYLIKYYRLLFITLYLNFATLKTLFAGLLAT